MFDQVVFFLLWKEFVCMRINDVDAKKYNMIHAYYFSDTSVIIYWIFFCKIYFEYTFVDHINMICLYSFVELFLERNYV